MLNLKLDTLLFASLITATLTIGLLPEPIEAQTESTDLEGLGGFIEEDDFGQTDDLIRESIENPALDSDLDRLDSSLDNDDSIRESIENRNQSDIDNLDRNANRDRDDRDLFRNPLNSDIEETEPSILDREPLRDNQRLRRRESVPESPEELDLETENVELDNLENLNLN